MTVRYGDEQNLIDTFRPDKIDRFAQDPVRCVCGEAPALCDVRAAYGVSVVRGLVMAYVRQVANYCGMKQGFSDAQCFQCAVAILRKYYYLNVAELMLYFSKLKSGEYGYFYGSIDPMRIVSWIDKFIVERGHILESEEARRREVEREAELRQRAANAVSRDEYDRWAAEHSEELQRHYDRIREEEQKKRQKIAELPP